MESHEHTNPPYPGVITPGAPPPGASAPYGDEPVPEGPIHPGSGRRLTLGRVGTGLGAAGLLLVKFGAKLKALLLLLPKLKVLTTSATMLVSIAAYSLIWGWAFALGFVVLLLVHELGHVLQLRREGIKASAPMFIPFLGAVIATKSLGRNALAEARVGLAGPVLGSAGAAALIPVASATGSDLYTALAFTGFFLNLFNLLPVVPLDGGRAMAALSPWMWLLGFAALVALMFVFPNPIMLLILLFGAIETWRRWQARKSPGSEEYYRVAPRHRVAVAAVYLGLIALLAVGMAETHIERDFGDV
jgi:Zn-dependent protease